jgi:hypothetical protein
MIEGVESSSATVVCIGANGLGKWQEVEMDAAVARQVEHQHRVIPVILPGVPAENIVLPPMLKRNMWVLLSSDTADRATLERLYWGITGQKMVPAPLPPAAPPAHLAEQDQAVEDALRNLRETLATENVVYIVGPGASQGGAALPPSLCEITRGLLLDLRLIENDYDQLLPPPDVAGSYYAAGSGTARLEGKVVDMIAGRSGSVPGTHQRLAELISHLSGRPKQRIRARAQQLIVTTNLDVMIERALLKCGISFTRLVQHTATPRIEVNQYRGILLTDKNAIQFPTPQGTRVVQPDNLEDLDEVIAHHGRSVVGDTGDEASSPGLQALPVKELGGDDPILFKFRGSQDVRGSCALSVDQYLNYTRRLVRSNCIPAQITEILSNSSILVLGYGFFDPEFRLLCHGLLRLAADIRQDPIYAVQPPPTKRARIRIARWSCGSGRT